LGASAQARAIARQRRHDDAVGEVEIAEPEKLKKRRKRRNHGNFQKDTGK